MGARPHFEHQTAHEKQLCVPAACSLCVPGLAHWSWEQWELWTGPVVTGLEGDPSPCRSGPDSYIHPSQLKPSPAASLQD